MGGSRDAVPWQPRGRPWLTPPDALPRRAAPRRAPTPRYIFERVDRLTGSGGQLDTSDFGTALILARTVILGY